MKYRIIPLALASLVLVSLLYTSALEAQEQQYVFVDEWDLEPGSGGIVTDQRGPYGIALDGSDNLYVTDRYNRCFISIAFSCSNIWRVEKFTSAGNFSSEFDWVWQLSTDNPVTEVSPHPSGIAVDYQGYIYVADPFNERIKKFSSKGGLLREWGSPGNGNGQFSGLQDLAVDSVGNVYATDTYNNRIQKFNSNGVFLAKWTSSRLYMPLGIAVDGSGNVYVTDGEVNRVLKFSPNGALLAEWGSGVGLYYPLGIDVDNQGNVYVADTYINRVVKFSPNGALLANWGREGDGRGEFINPQGVAVDSQGYVYVADTGNLRIQKFMPEAPLRDTITLTSGILNDVEINPSDPTIVVPEGARISGFLNITVQNGQIADVLFPVGATPTWGDREDSYWRIVSHSNPGRKNYTVKIDLEAPTAGTHYIIMACAAQPEVGYIMSCTDSGFGREDWDDGNDVVDWSASEIQSAIKNGYVNVPWLVKGGRYTNRDTGAAAVKVSVQSVKFLNKPTGVAAVPAYTEIGGYGGYVVADTDNHRIRKFANGVPVNTWGSQGDGDGKFRFPSDVAVDKSGNIYVVDKDNHRVQRFSSEGVFLWKWGTQGSGNAQFNFPRGIAVDDQGNVYVADSENYRVQKFSLNGSLLAKWGTRGSQPGQFQLPWGIAVDSSGNVYVADTDNNRIQKFNSDGRFLTAWGTAGYGDLQFNRPRGVDVDQQGNIYVADTFNHRIQAFTQEGVLFYKQGARGNGDGQFDSPHSIAVFKVSITSVVVYVADTNNDRIQDFLVALPEVPTSEMMVVAVQSVNDVAIGDFGNEYMRVTGDTVKVVVRVRPGPISGGEVQLWFRYDDSLNPGALDEDYDGYPDNGDVANSKWDGIDNDWDGLIDEEQRDKYGNDVKWGEVNVWEHAITTGGTVATDRELGTAKDWFEVTLTWDVSMLADEHQYEFMPIVVDGSGYGVDFNYQPLPWKRSDAQFPQGPDVSEYKIIIDHQAPYTYTQVVKNTDDYGPTDQGLDSWTPLICSESRFAGPDSMIVRTNDGVNNNRLYDLQAKVVSIYGGLDYTAGLDEGLGGVGEPFNPNAGGVIFQYSTDGVTWRNLGYDPDPDYLSTFVATNVFNPVAMMSSPIQRYQGNEMSYVGEMIPYTGRIINSDGIFTGQAVAYTQRIVVTTWSLDNFDILALPATNSDEYYFRAIAADLPDVYGSGRKNTTAVENSSKRDELVVENGIGKADENFMRDINWKLGVPFEVMPTSNASHRDLFRNLYTDLINLEFVTGPRNADGADNDGDGLVDENDENDGMDTSYRVYAIKSAAGPNGTIFPSGVVRVICGGDQKFIITPDPCYRIAGLLVDNEPVEPVTEEYIFENITSNHTIEARFVMTDYIIAATAGPNGTITPSGDVQVKCGSSQTFTMTPDIGYYLSELLVDGTRVEPEDTYTFTNVTSDHTIEARFSIKGYTITAIAGVNGSISPPGSTQVNHGGSATFIITPNPCYQIETVLVDNEPVDPGPEYTFQNVTSDHTIQAVFAVSEYIITATAGPNGNMLPSGEVSVRCGSDQKFTMIPATGYHLTELLVDGTQVKPEATYTFTNVTSNHTIEARFSIDTYGITSIAGENGSISPPSAQVSHGGSATFTITPDPCYQIETVLVDDEPVGALPEYTFQNVTSNRTIEAHFVINEYTITATAGPNGTISPSGDVVVPCGDDQEFTMTPAAGYHLSELLVDGTQVNPVSPYIFTNVTSNHTIEARFSIDTYTITSIARENGSISPPSAQVSHGGSATFTITPDPCYRIASLLVDNRPVDPVPEYTFQNVTSNRVIEARFVIDSYTIRSTSEGSGGIAPFGDVNVPCGSSSTFTITPAVGYHIADVLVDDRSVGTEPTYTFTNVTSDHTIRARFDLNQYIVTASAGDHGSISPAGDVQVSSAESLTFRMTPDPCYHVSDCLVDGRSVGAVGTYTFSNVTSDHSIGALFAINTYTIRSSAEANGSISPSGSANVICGSDQLFTIAPAEGYHVLDVLVDGRSVGVTTTHTFANVTSDHTIRARFGLTQYTISASAGEHGRISPSGEVGVSHGASQTFTITPDDCYRVADCLVNNQSVGPVTEYTFENVTSDQSIMATFEAATYTVTAVAGIGGSISPSSASVLCGSSQTFTITPDPCHNIADVLVNNESVGPVTEYTFSPTHPLTDSPTHSIRAVFETISYTITASAESGGNISPSGEVTVNCGSSQTFTITPGNCYNVADCLVNNRSVGPVTEYTFENVTSDQTIGATFEIATYTITASAGAGGSITPSGVGTQHAVSVQCGSSQTFIITADNCYNVADVLVNNQSVGPVTEYTFPDVTSDQTIEARFELATYTINATAGTGGSISPSGASVLCGSSQTFTITPNPCYHITGVLVDNESAGTGTEYTFDNVLSDHTIRAVFEINTYTITATAGANGRISPPGVITVNCGSSQTYTITPSQGYVVSNALVDGRSLGSMETYAFTNISSNHTISVSFRVADDVPPTGSVTINDNAQYTNNRTVNLRLSASDNSGVVSLMQFSNDNVNYSNWETYATTSQWQLSAGDGQKTVYARFRDGAGNQSTARSDSITLDTIPPTGRISINNGDEYTSSAAVSLTMSVTDSGSGLAQMSFSNNNASFSSPESYSSTTTWNLTSGDGVKTVYARFQDGAGNWTTATISDNITLDTEAPEVVTAPENHVPVNAPIQISFSEEIDEGSISVRVSGSISGNISGRTTYSNSQMTFVPDRNFADKEEITVEVVARDLADNRISFSVQFSTAFGVWPGDTNNDGVVNILDLLPVGQYWQERGDRRSPANTSWEVQHAIPWENEGATYVDADGNGVVDKRDLEVIKQNWGETQPTTAAPPVLATEDLERLQRLSGGFGVLKLASAESPDIEQLEALLFMLLNPAEARQIPACSSLGQNYPNPFNPDTWIPYQLANGSDVTIEIYNISGQLVRTISLGYKDAGMYITKQKAAYWDGGNDFGEPVSSGIYFYTIKAGNFTNTRKLIVVR